MTDQQDATFKAEQGVLGSLILEPEMTPRAGSVLKASDFRSESHRHIFTAFLTLSEQGKDIDLEILTQELQKAQVLESVGGQAYLVKLAAQLSTAAHIEAHMDEVKRASTSRKHERLAARWLARTKQPDYDPDKVAGDLIRVLVERSEMREMVTLDVVMGEVISDIDKPHPAMHTGVRALDAIFAGMDPGMVAQIFALPGIGKTAIGVQVLLAEARSGTYGVMFSAEMRRDRIGYRLLAHATGVDRQAWWAATATDAQWREMALAVEHYSGLGGRFRIDDSSRIGVDLLVMRAHLADRLARTDQKRLGLPETGIGLILVDYLQILKAADRTEDGTREQQVTDAIGALVTLAKSLDCRIIVISALAKDGSTRYSSAVDYDVDFRIALEPHPDGDEEHLTAKVVKGRDSPKGDVHLRFIGSQYRYMDWGAPPDPNPPPDRKPRHRGPREPGED